MKRKTKNNKRDITAEEAIYVLYDFQKPSTSLLRKKNHYQLDIYYIIFKERKNEKKCIKPESKKIIIILDWSRNYI